MGQGRQLTEAILPSVLLWDTTSGEGGLWVCERQRPPTNRNPMLSPELFPVGGWPPGAFVIFISFAQFSKKAPVKGKHKYNTSLLQGNCPRAPTSGSHRTHTREWSLFAWELKRLSAPLFPSSLNRLEGEETLCNCPTFPRYNPSWL